MLRQNNNQVDGHYNRNHGQYSIYIQSINLDTEIIWLLANNGSALDPSNNLWKVVLYTYHKLPINIQSSSSIFLLELDGMLCCNFSLGTPVCNFTAGKVNVMVTAFLKTMLLSTLSNTDLSSNRSFLFNRGF